MTSTTCNGNALFAENKLHGLTYNENKGLICGELICGIIRHLQKLGSVNIFLAHSQQLCP